MTTWLRRIKFIDMCQSTIDATETPHTNKFKKFELQKFTQHCLSKYLKAEIYSTKFIILFEVFTYTSVDT